MDIFSIDLSMRSTGVVYTRNGTLIDFAIISNKDLKDEDLFIHNINEIFKMFNKCEGPFTVALEGLSLRSLSGEKDKIYGQFWYLRCKLKELFPQATLKIVTVKEWRSPLFSKQENKDFSDAKKKYKKEKKKIKSLKGDARKEAILFNKNLEALADIKVLTLNKLPADIKQQFFDYINKNKFKTESIYDLTDSYFINKFLEG